MTYVIRLFEIEGDALATGRSGLAAKAAVELIMGEEKVGNYLKSYDPDAYSGRGDAVFTPHLHEAMCFPTMIHAHEFYRQTSKVRPTRSDGKPNRPLTAFSVTFQEVKT